MFLFIRGKFFALFSMLFGLSFFLQMDRTELKGIQFQMKFIWRLILLFVIGCFHQMFYSGDILTIYAVVGLILVLFFNASNRVVLTVSLIFLLGAARFASYSIFGIEDILVLENGRGDQEYWDILKSGTILEVFHINIVERMLQKTGFQIGYFGRGGLTIGFFLLGLWIGRTRVLENLSQNRKVMKDVVIWSSSGLGLFLLTTTGIFLLLGDNPDFDSWISMVALTSLDQFNFCFAILIAVGFLNLFVKEKWTKRLSVFAPYGRMALTNYFVQSVVGTYILFGWGLGFVGEIRNSYTFFIAIAIITLQIWWSHLWLTKFRYGPLEWLWRSATYLKWQPFLKAQHRS